MKYWTIKKMDTANGPWLRVSLFVSGCPHWCKWCFNAVAWDFDYGSLFTQDVIDEILDELHKDYITWITFLWWEPLAPENQKEVWNVIEQVRKECPDKTIWCFSGYTYEFVTEYMFPSLPYTEKIFSWLDVLVDGTFEQDLLDLKLKFRGSRNQRVLDVQKSLKNWIPVRSSEVNDKNLYVQVPSKEVERFWHLFKK